MYMVLNITSSLIASKVFLSWLTYSWIIYVRFLFFPQKYTWLNVLVFIWCVKHIYNGVSLSDVQDFMMDLSVIMWYHVFGCVRMVVGLSGFQCQKDWLKLVQLKFCLPNWEADVILSIENILSFRLFNVNSLEDNDQTSKIESNVCHVIWQ